MDDLRSTADPVIFLEKVRRPVLRGLVRDRLERRLADLRTSAREGSCLLVLAPPGSGKTTLLSQVTDGEGHPVAWYRASSEDGDELSLTRHLGYALGSALGDPVIIEGAATGRIVDLLRRLDRPDVSAVQLVVDDLHEIIGTPAEAALETFIRLRPRRIRIALGSRRQPGLNASLLLVSGELIMVDGEDLRFRSWEVEQLFRAVYDAPLSPEAAAALTRRTGGWAAGLQLFHLATARLSRAEREGAVTELSARSRLIRSYLARNVLDGLPPERRRFLLVTATLGVLTGDLCDELLNGQGSAAVLAELEREQFFTTSSDDGLTFHYHQVLQTHLEVLLTDELGSRAARDLYARSGLLLERAGRPADAVRAHARAEDWGAVARLLRPGSTVVAGDDTVWRLMALPGAPTDDPGLVLAGARRLARDGRIEPALAAYREAERLLDDPGFGRRCVIERKAVGVWLPRSSVVPQPAAPNGRDAESELLRLSIELRRLTRELGRPNTFEPGWLRGLAYALTGDLTAAQVELRVGPPTRAHAPGWEPLAAELVDCLVEAIGSPGIALVGRVETLTLTAELNGWPWLARLSRILQTVVQLRGGTETWRIEAAADLLSSLGRGEDRWSQLVAAVGVSVAARLAGIDSLATSSRAQAELIAAELDAAAVAAMIGQPTLTMVAGGLAVAEPIELRCLGAFGLRVGGIEADWRSLRPRTRSLLMLLALHLGRPLHRETIIEALWPEASLSSGIRSLQVAVSSVRQCLLAAGVPGDPISRRGEAYELVLPGALCDVAALERRADEARRLLAPEALVVRIDALLLYGGELLPEVGPADWVVGERDRLRLLVATVAGLAAADAAAADDLGLAVDLARRSLALDPFHDPAWRLIIESSERLGDLSAAAVARADHLRVLDDLGLVTISGRIGRSVRAAQR